MVDTVKILDPVKGLVDYVNDIKPYHTKVIESLVEYIGGEAVDVRFGESYNIEIGLIFNYDITKTGCENTGFGSLAFGDPNSTLILSPDPAQTVSQYPAIQPNNFIVLGDQKATFDALNNLTLKIASFVEEKIIAISKSTGSPPTGGSFSFSGTPQLYYTIGTVFTIKGSYYNDTSYIINTLPVYDNVNNITTINVDGQIVVSDDVSGFISTTDLNNTGEFSITSTIFTKGKSPIAPFTTVFISGLTLTPPTNINVNQRYVANLSTTGITYKKILSYSNALKFYNQNSSEYASHSPDEGIVYAPIVELSQGSPTYFVVEGDYTGSNIFIGDGFEVVSSTENNFSYTITSIEYIPANLVGSPTQLHRTRFGVDNIHNSKPDGFVRLDIPSNSFIVDGDYTDFFKQGTRLSSITGSVSGDYNVLYSRFVNNETRIRVLETLISGRGALITNTTPTSFFVDGDHTAAYRLGVLFNVDSSVRNDGVYTIVAQSVYNATNHTTNIQVAEVVDITDATGEIHEFAQGVLKYKKTGFSQTPTFCEVIPETLVAVDIKDKLTIDGIGIFARDDIFAHGVDKNTWGTELPTTTIFASGAGIATGPVVLFTEPATPNVDDIWFDSTANTDSISAPGTLKVYQQQGSPSVLDWVVVPRNKLYWVDTDTNYMYYRIVYQYYDNGYPQPTIPDTDTNWVLEFTKVPSFNEQIVAGSIRELQGFQSFFATESSTSVAETIFNFTGSPLLSIPLVLVGSPPIQIPNPTLLEVTVNSAPALVNILTATSFDIVSPRLRVGDFVEAKIFDNTGMPSGTFVGSFDAKTSVEEKLDLLLGYKFYIDGTDTLTNTIHIPDTAYFTGSPPTLAGWQNYNIFMQGSPLALVDSAIEIVGSLNNDGIYTISSVSQEVSPTNHLVLTVVEPLQDSGIFSAAPTALSGDALYQRWFQYIIVNTTTTTLVVLGDATLDTQAGNSFKVIYSSGSPNNDGVYTVNAATYDGRNTTITTIETISNVGVAAGGWIEST